MHKLLRQKDVAALFGGISPATMWRYVQKGILPKPMKFGNRNYWHEEEIKEALERFVAKLEETR